MCFFLLLEDNFCLDEFELEDEDWVCVSSEEIFVCDVFKVLLVDDVFIVESDHSSSSDSE